MDNRIKMKKENQSLKNSLVGMIPADWEVKSLGELVHKVEYGSSAKSDSIGSVPVIRMGNIQNGKIVLDKLVYSNDQNEIQKYRLNYDDVLFNRTNTIDLVGKTGIFRSGLIT
jgi:type I restriction enzyme, S subunit